MTSPRVPGSPYESTEGEPAVLSPPIHTPQTRRDGAMTRNQRSCWSPANQRDSWSDTFRLLWWREEQITWFWCGSHVILTASFIMNELQGSWASSGNFIFTSFRCFLCLIVRSDPQPRRYWPPINNSTYQSETQSPHNEPVAHFSFFTSTFTLLVCFRCSKWPNQG